MKSKQIFLSVNILLAFVFLVSALVLRFEWYSSAMIVVVCYFSGALFLPSLLVSYFFSSVSE